MFNKGTELAVTTLLVRSRDDVTVSNLAHNIPNQDEETTSREGICVIFFCTHCKAIWRQYDGHFDVILLSQDHIRKLDHYNKKYSGTFVKVQIIVSIETVFHPSQHVVPLAPKLEIQPDLAYVLAYPNRTWGPSLPCCI